MIRLTPNDADGFSNRGATWKLKGDADRAITDLNAAIGLNPKDACAVYNRAAVWSDKGDTQIAPSPTTARRSALIRITPSRSTTAASSGRPKVTKSRAIADYREAIRLNPNVAFYYLNRGDAWRDKGDNERAIADYSEAIRLDPTSALTLRRLAKQKQR